MFSGFINITLRLLQLDFSLVYLFLIKLAIPINLLVHNAKGSLIFINYLYYSISSLFHILFFVMNSFHLSFTVLFTIG